MSSTYSALKFELITTGEQSGSWGNTTNTNIGTAIEQAIVGMATLTSANFTSNVATLTLTNTNSAQNARALCLVISGGSLSAAGTINVPAIQKPYLIINSDIYAVTVKVSGQTGVTVPVGKRTVVYNNGTDVSSQIDWLSTLTLTTPLAVTSGGTGTATPSIVAGSGVSVTGTWPNQTIAATTSGTVTSVTGTAPVVSSGGATPAISIPAATTSVNGYLTSTDWNTFNNKVSVSGAIGTPSSGIATNITGLPLTTGVTGILPVANGGSGTATPSIVAGTNVTVTGTWPNQTINASGGGGGTVTSVTATSPVASTGGSAPVISMPVASSSVNGYLSSTDWTTFNSKQAAGSYVTVGGALGTPSSGTLTNCTFPTLNQNTTGTAAGLSSILAVASGGTGTATPALVAGSNVTITGTWPNQTINSTASGGGGGTVTSVAALTLGTSGTDLSSTVANGTTTPVITLNVPTASASNRGVLSAADWTTFNNKGSGTVTSVTGTAPVVSSGGTTPAISMAAASTSTNGYLTSTDWNTFNGKQAAGSYVTVGGALGTPSSGTLTNCTFPTLNQNTTGSSGSCTGNAATATTATNLSGGTVAATTITATGNITAYYSSDIRFKQNVRAIPDALSKVNAIGGKLFDWTDEYIEAQGGADGYFVQKSDFGVIAQDVLRVFPVAVRRRADGTLAVDYEKLAAMAFAALVELTARVEALESK